MIVQNSSNILNCNSLNLFLFRTKFIFSQILPLIGPTKLIMGMSINNYQWHEFFPENGKHFMSFSHLPIFATYSVSITSFNSHSVTTTETHNICIVIAIWAPIILVSIVGKEFWNIELHLIPLIFLNICTLIHSIFICFYRFILWIHKYGMLFMPLCLVALLEPSAIWERLVACLLQHFIFDLCNPPFLVEFLFNPTRK